MRPQSQNKVPEGPRVNQRIRVPEVRLIDYDGEQLGVVSIQTALARAEERGLDLVELSPNAKPPVCKLVDYGKFKYQQNKKAQEVKKKQVSVEVKEVSLTPNTSTNDLQTKQNHIKKWLDQKNRIKVSVKFRGREMAHIDLGRKIMQVLYDGIAHCASMEGEPKMEGRRLIAMFIPKLETKIKKSAE